MSLRTMLGKYDIKKGFYLVNCALHISKRCSQSTNDWEFTKHRKKPAGGGRLLTNPNEFNQFNAWLVE